MTNRTGSAAPAPRIIACARCDTAFSCDLAGTCWCMEEPAKLPMPSEGEDCLCKDCLRQAAANGA